MPLPRLLEEITVPELSTSTSDGAPDGALSVAQLASDLSAARTSAAAAEEDLSAALRPHLEAWLRYLTNEKLRTGSAYCTQNAEDLIELTFLDPREQSSAPEGADDWDVESVYVDGFRLRSVYGDRLDVPLLFVTDPAAWITTDQQGAAELLVAARTKWEKHRAMLLREVSAGRFKPAVGQASLVFADARLAALL